MEKWRSSRYSKTKERSMPESNVGHVFIFRGILMSKGPFGLRLSCNHGKWREKVVPLQRHCAVSVLDCLRSGFQDEGYWTFQDSTLQVGSCR